METSKLSPDDAVVRCRVCLSYVGVDHVEEAVARPKGMVRLAWLHLCGTEGASTIPMKRWKKLLNRDFDRKMKSGKVYDSEAVGKAVQGFRIDLDAVDTVVDLQLLWDDQERHERWSIPREKAWT